MKKPKIKSSHYIHRGFFDVREDLLEREDGLTRSYTSLILSTHAAAIVAQDKEGRWILNREYRHPTGEFVLGCPGGRLEPDEDPIDAGRRELFEETGYWAEKIQIIGCCYLSPALCDQKIYYLWAQNADPKGNQKLEPFEFIQTELKTDSELKEAIRSGSHIDAVLLTALWYKDQFCYSGLK